MKHLLAMFFVAAVCHARGASAGGSDENSPPMPSVPDGFSIELVAAPPLVERPVVAAFDHEGRLYVAESSGSNDPVEQQLAERPHRVVRLDDVDGDGHFDKRVVFADRMMFLAGAMFHDGSLYVSAPPSIWKLTDRDGDGVAEERVEWFQGKTLTGCANDLHGPYLGPDGWIYWCKGAFAEQTHIVNGREWKSRASHIFRSRADGAGLEPVLTGGMDNPVDVVFTPEGERILSATIIQAPNRRDGLLHAVYGGVYGKQHGVLDGHPRTGELMPPLASMSPVAPSGLERYDSLAFGAEYRGNLFTCQFNVRKVSRHILSPEGSTFLNAESDFVTSDAVDFHPTDVLMDADGSLLVIDTGGWYKLCCPTSQLWKPDELGGIYRVRRTAAAPIEDPRGRNIDWSHLTVKDIWGLLSDPRPAVRARLSEELVRYRDSPELQRMLEEESLGDALLKESGDAVLPRAWALTRLGTESAQRITRRLLDHVDPRVRQAALHGISLHRDTAAAPRAIELLQDEAPPVRRVSAEALGRLGDSSAISKLLAAAAGAEDRILQHSITYAIIELSDSTATQAGLASDEPGTIATALVALDQMPGGNVTAEEVIPHLSSSDNRLRGDARWLVRRHPEWGPRLAGWLREQLAAPRAAIPSPLEEMLIDFAGDAEVQGILAQTVRSGESPASTRQLALRVMGQASVERLPQPWSEALVATMATADPQLTPLAVAVARRISTDESLPIELNRALTSVAADPQYSQEVRLDALAAAVGGLDGVDDGQWTLLTRSLEPETSVRARAAAADALARAPLSPDQLDQLREVIAIAGPLELNRLLAAYQRSTDEQLAVNLIASLDKADSLQSLRIDVLRRSLANFGQPVQRSIDDLELKLNVDAAEQRRQIEQLLPHMADGDVRRGHAIFNSAKAACTACHVMGYAGGEVGPELTRIGDIRTERDLLESILYPSLSFVQSYEPTLILTTEGKAVSGRVIDETDQYLVVATGPDEQIRVRREEIEEIQPSDVSVMPAGLDKQLTVQELADLVAFLKNAK